MPGQRIFGAEAAEGFQAIWALGDVQFTFIQSWWFQFPFDKCIERISRWASCCFGVHFGAFNRGRYFNSRSVLQVRFYREFINAIYRSTVLDHSVEPNKWGAIRIYALRRPRL